MNDNSDFNITALRAEINYISARDELINPNSIIRSAQPYEPVFVLRARDPIAIQVIDWWIWRARNLGAAQYKLDEAMNQRRAYNLWLDKKMPMNNKYDNFSNNLAKDEIENQNSILNTAHKDEPVFVLVASDILAVESVEFWAFIAYKNNISDEKIKNALQIAKNMSTWTNKHIPSQKNEQKTAQANNITDNPVTKLQKNLYIICLKCGDKNLFATAPFDQETIDRCKNYLQNQCTKCDAKPDYDKTGKFVRVLHCEYQ